MKAASFKRFLPAPMNAVLAFVSAILLVLAFPDFELWFLAWFALVPLFFAIEREKESAAKSLVVGWIFGTSFFFGSCWWLTFAPITYAGFPFLLAYFLLFLACLAVGFFSAIFSALFSVLLKRFGVYAIFSAPFLWTAIEFLRFWTTGNNWNAIGYSQAFKSAIVQNASIGGIYLVGFLIVLFNAYLVFKFVKILVSKQAKRIDWALLALVFAFITLFLLLPKGANERKVITETATIVAIQPNVPMSGLNYEKYQQLRRRHVELAEDALQKVRQTRNDEKPVIVVFPESPMNFMYSEDTEFQEFVKNFAAKNNVSVLFNAAEPDARNKAYFNSAVMVGADGKKLAQYDKIYLVPFGESVPTPLKNIVPALVGSFSYGEEYDLLPFGEAKAGVMICFESHFGNLSAEFVRNGADVLVEMTNDGYLGETPVLRQHLANAVFRAVETNRPVLRVTNVGVTAYINERGEVFDAAESYTEATRVWTVAKS
ncbi:MAG TPA: apolipoprotein N-acyltransferase, partial [Pyrinomonadaceae bacterium]